MQDRPVGFQIEAFHVDKTTIARVHYYRYAQGLGFLTRNDLHGHAVAFFDQQVELAAFGEELIDVRLGDPFGVAVHLEEGIQLGDLACGVHHLGDPQLVYAAADTVQVTELQRVEVRQSQLAEAAFLGHGKAYALPNAEADHAHFLGRQQGLLFARDLVAVAIGAHQGEFEFVQQVYQPMAPWVVHPHAVVLRWHGTQVGTCSMVQLVLGEFYGRVQRLHQFGQLRMQPIDHGEPCIALQQVLQPRQAIGLSRSEEHRPVEFPVVR